MGLSIVVKLVAVCLMLKVELEDIDPDTEKTRRRYAVSISSHSISVGCSYGVHPVCCHSSEVCQKKTGTMDHGIQCQQQ